jgi:transcriptional regulator with XRE-family HTH domain
MQDVKGKTRHSQKNHQKGALEMPTVNGITKEVMSGIGSKIRQIREALGVGTRDFARGIPGLLSSNLSEIERGVRRPTVNIIVGICQKYGVPLDEIVPLTQVREGFHPSLSTKIKTRLVPVYTKQQIVNLFGQEENPVATNNAVMAEKYTPAPTKDALAFYYEMDGVSCPACICGGPCQDGDQLLIEPAAKICDGNKVIAIGKGTALLRVYYQKNGEVILVGDPDDKPITLSAGAAKEYKFYRITSVLKTL